MSPTTLNENIHVGTIYQFERTLHKDDEAMFGTLSGDTSTSDIVHGMLAASLFSTLIDIYGPGPESIYVSQTLQFRKPLYYEKALVVRGVVMDISISTRIITLKTEILCENEICIDGEAKIKL